MRMYGQLALATLGIGYALVRMLVPSLAMPLLVVPPLLLLLWLGWRLVHPPVTLQTPLGWPLLACALVLVASSFQAVTDPGEVVAILFFWGGSVGIILFLMMFLLAAGWSPSIFMQAMLLTITVLLLHASWDLGHFWHTWLSAWQPGVSLLPPLVPQDFIGMSHTEAVIPFYTGIPLVMMALWRAESLWQRAGWAIWLVLALLVIFYTSSRGGWLAMVAEVALMVAVLLWSAYRARQTRRLVVTVVLSAAYAALFAVLFLNAYGFLQVTVGTTDEGPTDTTPAMEPLVEEAEDVTTLTSPMGRRVFWARALDIFANHPVLGAGPGGYPTRYQVLEPERSKAFLPTHAHSIPLAFLSELGVLGGGVFVVPLVWGALLWWRGWRATRALSEEWLTMLACAAIGVGMAVHGIFDVPAVQNGSLGLYALVVGLGVAGCWQLAEVPPAGGGAGRVFNQQNPTRPATRQTVFWSSLRWPHPLHMTLVVATLLAWAIATLVFLQGG